AKWPANASPNAMQNAFQWQYQNSMHWLGRAGWGRQASKSGPAGEWAGRVLVLGVWDAAGKHLVDSNPSLLVCWVAASLHCSGRDLGADSCSVITYVIAFLAPHRFAVRFTCQETLAMLLNVLGPTERLLCPFRHVLR